MYCNKQRKKAQKNERTNEIYYQIADSPIENDFNSMLGYYSGYLDIFPPVVGRRRIKISV